MKIKTYNLLIIFLLILASCGGNSSEADDSILPSGSTTGSDTGSGDTTSDEPILTGKLVGTPFEGMTIGDDVPWCQFLQDAYLTTTITEADLPIPIFLAFFTASEEEIIKEGIEVANEGMGINLFEVTNVWCEKCRIILKVDYIYDQKAADSEIPESYFQNVLGHTVQYYYSFGHTFSSEVVTDWSIEIRSDAVEQLGWQIIAHELGHAMGIQLHSLINYESDTVSALESDSIMSASAPEDPTLNDYNTMMAKQFEVLQEHYSLTEENPGGICP